MVAGFCESDFFSYCCWGVCRDLDLPPFDPVGFAAEFAEAFEDVEDVVA
jgi:hypothetical protein